jgi:coatomer subunit beta'
MSITSYTLSLSLISYQTAILRGDFELAQSEILPTIPKNELNKVARFLEGKDMIREAMEITNDIDHKFELALKLGELDTAMEMIQSSTGLGEPEMQIKYKLLADLALSKWDFALAQKCFELGQDMQSLYLLYSSIGDVEGVKRVAKQAEEKGVNNLAFVAHWQAGEVAPCVELLLNTSREAEAALMARTYMPRYDSTVLLPLPSS